MIVLLVIVLLGLVVTRIGTVALTFTGLSRDLARFQARSAFTGVGFTTRESERVLEHPVRRKIIMLLMLLGNAGFIAAVSSLLPVFINAPGQGMGILGRLGVLVSGLAVLWAISLSKWLDRQLSRAIEWAIRRWTSLEVWDYPNLLHLSSGYSVCELTVSRDDWLTGKTLAEVRLGDEGAQVLGIRRADGTYVGAPTGATYLRAGDQLVVYGRSEHVAELDQRRAGRQGDEAHEQRVAELRQTQMLQETDQVRRMRERLRAGNDGDTASTS
ncbi:MAG TPA: potassium transporter TrkA [Candidatus Hydrogenedentes bacterium]|nr:potassium transporter TrkA [Candidatus Hydrogenedentota bacterium]